MVRSHGKMESGALVAEASGIKAAMLKAHKHWIAPCGWTCRLDAGAGITTSKQPRDMPPT
jgi:hypothetical protein